MRLYHILNPRVPRYVAIPGNLAAIIAIPLLILDPTHCADRHSSIHERTECDVRWSVAGLWEGMPAPSPQAGLTPR